MENTPNASTLPPPPIPPPELLQSSPSADPAAASPVLTPELLKSAGEDWANFAAMGLDFFMMRRGWTPTSATELEHLAARFERVVTKYPAMATPSKYPELGVLGLVAGMLMMRSKLEVETLAAEAEEKRRVEGQGKQS